MKAEESPSSKQFGLRIDDSRSDDKFIYIQSALKNVLVTRATNQAKEFVDLLTQSGFTPVLFPMIEIIPPYSWDACDKAIDALYMYDGIIFTSANGVIFFFSRLNERRVSTGDLQNKIICAVGEKTKSVFEHFGLPVTVMPEKFTSDDLFRALNRQDIRNRFFLHPCGNLTREHLSGNLILLGAKVDRVIFYQTVQPKQTDINEIKSRLLSREIGILTFTSPSTIKNFVAMLTPDEFQTISSQATLVVIGNVTEKTARESGFKHVFSASTSTVTGMIQKISELSFNSVPQSTISSQ